MKFFNKNLLWAFTLAKWRLEKYLLLPFKSVPSTTAERFSGISVSKDISVLMSDGVRLCTDIYKPNAQGSFPVILIRMPYGKREFFCWMPSIGKYWAKRGYACVVQDVRGKWSSEGKFDPFVNEAADGYDTLDWIASKSWCDGNIGMMGESYYGYTTWAVATLDHPNLKCIAPCTTAMDIYSSWIYNSGAFCLQTMGSWPIEMNAKKFRNEFRLDYRHLPLVSMDDKAGLSCDYYKDWIRHPVRDSYWEQINLSHKYAQIKIPALHLGGWYDMFLRSTIEDWEGVKTNSDDALASENQWLLIGPWDHTFTTNYTKRIGQIDIGDSSRTTYWDNCHAFFDYWLMGVDNGFDKTPRVKVFTIGDNQWQSQDKWPIDNTTYSEFYLHSGGNAHLAEGDGSLSPMKPTSAEPVDRYVYDPNDPVALTTDTNLWRCAKFLLDRARLSDRPDVLIYDSKPLETDMEITGPIRVTLFAASTARDTDFTASLVDLFPNCYAHLIQEGIIRAGYRKSDCKRTLIEPDRAYAYTIDLWSTSYVIKKGHNIRVEISSSNFNRYDRNPNTGNTFGMDAEVNLAEQTIYHNEEYPSRITLPIIPR